MPDRFDAIIGGCGPVGTWAALALARSGRLVLLVDPGEVGPSACPVGVAWKGIPPGAPSGWLPSRRIAERRLTLLAPEASVSIDLRNTNWAKGPTPPCVVEPAAFASHLVAEARRSGATVWESSPITAIRADANGQVRGVDAGGKSAEAPVTVLEDPRALALGAKAGLRLSPPPTVGDASVLEVARETVFGLPSSKVDDRMGPGAGVGICLESVLGFLPRGAMGFGYLLPGRESICAGIVLHAPSLARAGGTPEKVAAQFEAHPCVAPYLRGATRQGVSTRVLTVRGSRRPTLCGNGFLLAGEASGVLPTSGFVAPSLDLLLRSGPMVAETVREVLETKDPTSRVTSRYAARLARAGLFGDLERIRGGGARFKWNPRLHTLYPQLFASFFRKMMTERGQPKEHIRDLLRSVAKESKVPYTGVALDALGAMANL